MNRQGAKIAKKNIFYRIGTSVKQKQMLVSLGRQTIQQTIQPYNK